jgi:hypothetical protein
MKTAETDAFARPSELQSHAGDELLLPLIDAPATTDHPSSSVIIGRLVALVDGVTPLVTFPRPLEPVAVAARSIIDLHAGHISRDVVLSFDNGDFTKPIVMGVLRGADGWPAEQQRPTNVEVEADDQRLIVTAKDQLVLRCGQASITLTRAGKILIKGTYVSNDSSGVVRLRGGSIQLN